MKMFINILLAIMILFEINGFPLSKDILLKQNKPEENPDLFEGDMRFPNSKQSRGVLLRGDSVAWTNGIVPYEIAPEYGSIQRSFIISTMQKMERLISVNNVVCIQFRPRILSDVYYITIRNRNGCSSYVGQNTGIEMERTVSLQYPGCIDEARIMHELLHTLGFFHEQSRPDRDNYVRVNYENIISGLIFNFEKYNNSYVDTLNTSYDYASVMHYERDAFSSNGLLTIEPLQPNIEIGQRYNMSTTDIEEVRLFYNCSSNGITFPTIPTTTTVNLYPVDTTISSSLTTNSCMYSLRSDERQENYYESYEVNVSSDRYLRFTSNSSMDTYGFLYEENFFPNSPYLNYIISDDDTGGSGQFNFEFYLQSNIKYILVLTTYDIFITGDYQLIISGLTSVNITKLNNTCNITTTTTTNPFISTSSNEITSTSSSDIISIYSSALTRDSLTFTPNLLFSIHYYEPIIIFVSINGLYSFQSISNADIYGLLYFDYFNPSNLTENFLDIDDDSAGTGQFLIRYTLQSNSRYILVTTTFDPNVTTSFSILASGPERVYFNSINNTSTTTEITSTTTQTTSTTTQITSTTTTQITSTATQITPTTSGSTQLNGVMIYRVLHIMIGYIILMIIY